MTDEITADEAEAEEWTKERIAFGRILVRDHEWSRMRDEFEDALDALETDRADLDRLGKRVEELLADPVIAGRVAVMDLARSAKP